MGYSLAGAYRPLFSRVIIINIIIIIFIIILLLLKLACCVCLHDEGTPGTAAFYRSHGFEVVSLEKPPEQDEEASVAHWLKSRKIDLVINIPEGTTRRDEVSAGYLMRRYAVDFGCSLITNLRYCCRVKHLNILIISLMLMLMLIMFMAVVFVVQVRRVVCRCASPREGPSLQERGRVHWHGSKQTAARLRARQQQQQQQQ
jgi:flagellar basal body-associated protein FliL